MTVYINCKKTKKNPNNQKNQQFYWKMPEKEWMYDNRVGIYENSL